MPHKRYLKPFRLRRHQLSRIYFWVAFRIADDAITYRLSCDACRLHITQSDSGELLQQLDIQFPGRWNLMRNSPSQCGGCSDIQRHAAVTTTLVYAKLDLKSSSGGADYPEPGKQTNH
jgi:hypothetical protein